MPATRSGHKKAGGRAKGTPNKRTKQKAEAMQRVLESECRRELGITDILSVAKQKKTFELLYEIGESERNVPALRTIADRVVAPLQSVKLETKADIDITGPIATRVLEVEVHHFLPCLKCGYLYNSWDDPEATHYGPRPDDKD